jgi:hypothetical protein
MIVELFACLSVSGNNWDKVIFNQNRIFRKPIQMALNFGCYFYLNSLDFLCLFGLITLVNNVFASIYNGLCSFLSAMPRL